MTEKAEVVNQPVKQTHEGTLPGWLNWTAALAAVGASLCCVGPFILVLLGIGGGWMSTLVAFSPYRPFFVGITLILLGWAFYKLYLVKPCAAGEACASPAMRKRQRMIFWLVTFFIVGLIAFPWYAPWFLEK